VEPAPADLVARLTKVQRALADRAQTTDAGFAIGEWDRIEPTAAGWIVSGHDGTVMADLNHTTAWVDPNCEDLGDACLFFPTPHEALAALMRERALGAEREGRRKAALEALGSARTEGPPPC
jgi:hypothetical protein